MRLPATLEVVPSGPLTGTLAAPASKSVTNRLLVIAALARGTSTLRHPLVSDDSRVMRRLVVALGAAVAVDGGGWVVGGTGGELRSPDGVIDVELSGTAMRFGSALAALAPATVTVTGSAGLRRRPVGPLTSALRVLGATVTDRDGYPPVSAHGGLAGGSVAIDVGASSQFASALLMVAPYAAEPVFLELDGPHAGGYVELTSAAMRRWGAEVTGGGGEWHVRPSVYGARDEAVAADASAAAHLYALAAATGGRVTVSNAASGHDQPDAALPTVLETMGVRVERLGDAIALEGPLTLSPIDVDVAAMPDQVTTLAALAALAPGTSRLRGAAVTRGHETDRLGALATELGKLGAAVKELPDGLEVTGGTLRGPAVLDPHGDHRLAMAFAAIAARVPGIVIGDPGCVAKTYPRFWDDAASLGLKWRPAP